uniref:Uncharacterized protein n=1 Tax=Romanomermis culicivorax TaxID=13658 RepID=A0A915J0A2_ROMCU
MNKSKNYEEYSAIMEDWVADPLLSLLETWRLFEAVLKNVLYFISDVQVELFKDIKEDNPWKTIKINGSALPPHNSRFKRGSQSRLSLWPVSLSSNLNSSTKPTASSMWLLVKRID